MLTSKYSLLLRTKNPKNSHCLIPTCVVSSAIGQAEGIGVAPCLLVLLKPATTEWNKKPIITMVTGQFSPVAPCCRCRFPDEWSFLSSVLLWQCKCLLVLLCFACNLYLCLYVVFLNWNLCCEHFLYWRNSWKFVNTGAHLSIYRTMMMKTMTSREDRATITAMIAVSSELRTKWVVKLQLQI